MDYLPEYDKFIPPSATEEDIQLFKEYVNSAIPSGGGLHQKGEGFLLQGWWIAYYYKQGLRLCISCVLSLATQNKGHGRHYCDRCINEKPRQKRQG